MWQLIKLAWRSIWRNKRRTIITLSSIGFSLGLAVFFVAFAEGMYVKLIDDAVRMQAGHLTLEHTEYRDAPAVDLVINDVEHWRDLVEKVPGVERTKALVFGQGVAKSGQGAIGVALMGVEPSVEAGSSPLATKLVAGEYLADGDKGKVVVGTLLARRLKLERKKEVKRLMKTFKTLLDNLSVDPVWFRDQLKIHLSLGKKVVIASNNVNGEMAEELVRVKGIFETGAVEIDGFFIQVPIDFARKLYGLEAGQATQLGVVVDEPDRRDEVLEQVRLMIGPAERVSAVGMVTVPHAAVMQAGEDNSDIAVRPWEEVLPDLAAYIEVDGGSNMIFQGILIFLVMFTIFNSILMSVLERRREFAVLLALGTPPGWLKGQILLESAMIGLLGVFVGLLVGGLSGYAMQVYGLDLTSAMEGMSVSGFAIDPILHAKVTWTMLLTMGAIVFFSTLFLSLYPMGRIKRIPVAEVLR